MKLLLVSLSVLLGVAYGAKWGQHPHESLGENQDLGIIDGQTVPIATYPFMVSISLYGDVWGSGVILNKNWVLTTAFNVLYMEGTTVRAGSNKWKTGGQSPAVANATVHPDYTGGWDNDVALLQLATPLKLNAKVKVIKLGTDLPAAGTVGQVMGWGQTATSAQGSNVLRVADNVILDTANCSSVYGSEYSATLFCSQTSTQGPCVYDFGDPLVVENKLYGLYAGGNGCSTFPRLYANIPNFAAWINSVINP